MRFVLLVAALLCAGSVLRAQEFAMQFDQMPVGTKLFVEFSDGRQWIDEYAGEISGYHLIERRYSGDSAVTKYYFTAQGHWHMMVSPEGRTLKLSPHSCMRVLGECEAKISGTTKKKGIERSVITFDGKWYREERTHLQTGEVTIARFRLGKHNTFAERYWTDAQGQKLWYKQVNLEE